MKTYNKNGFNIYFTRVGERNNATTVLAFQSFSLFLKYEFSFFSMVQYNSSGVFKFSTNFNYQLLDLIVSNIEATTAFINLCLYIVLDRLRLASF